MLTELQQTTLCDVLRTAGLKERQIEDVLLLLRFKPHRVQLAFYYRAQGMTFEQVASIMDISNMQAWKYVMVNCTDIHDYIKHPIYQKV